MSQPSPIQRALEALQSAFNSDPGAIERILTCKSVVASDWKHPTIPRDTDGYLSGLGLINGLLCAATGHRLAAQYDGDRLVGIQLYPEADEGPCYSDGCDHEGFKGGCERAGHTPETCPGDPALLPAMLREAAGHLAAFHASNTTLLASRLRAAADRRDPPPAAWTNHYYAVPVLVYIPKEGNGAPPETEHLDAHGQAEALVIGHLYALPGARPLIAEDFNTSEATETPDEDLSAMIGAVCEPI